MPQRDGLRARAPAFPETRPADRGCIQGPAPARGLGKWLTLWLTSSGFPCNAVGNSRKSTRLGWCASAMSTSSTAAVYRPASALGPSSSLKGSSSAVLVPVMPSLPAEHSNCINRSCYRIIGARHGHSSRVRLRKGKMPCECTLPGRGQLGRKATCSVQRRATGHAKSMHRLCLSAFAQRELTACCKQAASKGHAGDVGACLGERGQAPDGVPAACRVQVRVGYE